MSKINIPRIMIVSSASGGGKTTFTSALLRLLKERGHKTAAFKCGPDYIDPMFCEAACGRQAVNLDLFFSAPNELKLIFANNSASCDMAVIEGVMGYYDGISMDSAEASSYDISRALDCPSVLIVPAHGMAYTVVPVIKGLVKRSSGMIKAVILNNVSEAVYTRLKPVIEREIGIRAAGYIPKLEYGIKSRHLGLVTPDKGGDTEKIISHNAETISKTVDIDLLTELARGCEAIDCDGIKPQADYKAKIGIARDEAFCFFYKDNIDILKSMGAEPVYFSPVNDVRLPDGIRGIILCGGYPEIYAKELSRNKGMLYDIKTKTENGMPCLAECGGFMYLHSFMEGEDGHIYDMADVIPGRALKTSGLVRFGYVNLSGDNEFIKRGETIKAHEFHYWDSTENGGSCIASKPNGGRSWECMHCTDSLFAGFPHLYYRSCPQLIERFMKKASVYD